MRDRLRDHGFDVRLCATELFTNVIDRVGQGTPVTVRVVGPVAWDGRTGMEVTPAPRAAAVPGTAEGGRGLALVVALSERWGVEQGPDHKTVWCEL